MISQGKKIIFSDSKEYLNSLAITPSEWSRIDCGNISPYEFSTQSPFLDRAAYIDTSIHKYLNSKYKQN